MQIAVRLTFGRTLAISWLPVAESARSTIMALRALYRLVRYESERAKEWNAPLRRFTHALDDPVQGVLPTFLQRLRDGLDTLLVRGVF